MRKKYVTSKLKDKNTDTEQQDSNIGLWKQQVGTKSRIALVSSAGAMKLEEPPAEHGKSRQQKPIYSNQTWS